MRLPELIGSAGRKLRRRKQALLHLARRARAGPARSRRHAVDPQSDRPKLVLVIVIDGLRPDSIDPHPHLRAQRSLDRRLLLTETVGEILNLSPQELAATG